MKTVIGNECQKHSTVATVNEKIIRYWSCRPGDFVDSLTGSQVGLSSTLAPTFAGTIREWYETLVEEIVSVNRLSGLVKSYIHVPPNLLPILEACFGFRPAFDPNLLIPDNDDFNPNIVGLLCRDFTVVQDESLPDYEILISNGSWAHRSKIIVLNV